LQNLAVVSLNRPANHLEEAYAYLCERFQGKITDIILVPFLIRGGGDKAMIELTRTLAGNPGRRVLVLATQGGESPWKAHIQSIDGADFIETKSEFKHLSHEEMQTLLLRMVQNWSIQTFTITNSMLGYDLLKTYGDILKRHASIFVHLYSLGFTKQGFQIEWLPVSAVYKYVNKIIVDSNALANELKRLYGWNDKKIFICHLPSDERMYEQAKNQLQKRIIIAARIAREKIPDVALEVCEQLQKDGIKIDIYGTKDEEYAAEIGFDSRVKSLKNVKYKGSFEGYHSLDLSKYDMLLHTSLLEGIPLTLIDTLRANLFIVVAKVGGIPEIIQDGKTGFLAQENTNPEAYIERIRRFYKDKKLHDTDRRREFNEKILKRHNKQAYKQKIKNLYVTAKLKK
jgi:glycosyltransferase involved in cell wall biosynthesis